MTLGMAGLFNAEHALAAIAMARIAGIGFEDIAIFCDFDSGHGGNAAGADDEYFSHCVCVS